MFRKMRRFRQQLSEADCIRLLKEQPRGVLSMLGDGGYPYGIPLDHWYSEAEHKLFFHCAKVGHKLDAIAACDKVSYCVMDAGYRKEGEWALNISSVVVFGRIRVVEDEEKKPICVLDDVTSELDAEHNARLFEILKEFSQAFVTTTQYSIEGASYVDVAANKATRRNQ